MKRSLILITFAAIMLFSTIALADVPNVINYQGRLTDISTGKPVPDDDYTVTFRIYDDPEIGPSPLWTAETTVSTTNGLFNVVLGSFQSSLPFDLFSGGARYLGIQVQGSGELYPRTPLISVPYSFHSHSSDTSGLALTIASNTVSTLEIQNGTILFEDIGPNEAAEGQVMKWNGSAWMAQNDSIGGGGDADWVIDGDNMYSGVSGDVGVGTATPTEKLDVDGNLSVSGKTTIGSGNTNSTTYGLVAGQDNVADAEGAAVLGGRNNEATGTHSSIGGGLGNIAIGNYSTIGGGHSNKTTGNYNTVAGGYENDAAGSYSTAVGGFDNEATGDHSTVGGGQNNIASADYATVTGGEVNYATGYTSTIAGGRGNESSAALSTVGGGFANRAEGEYSTVSGGNTNITAGNWSTIGGGTNNGSVDSGNYSTVGGGESNNANGSWSTVAGGYSCAAAGDYSFTYGNNGSAKGDYSFAGGNNASALHDGAFVFADASSKEPLESSAPNQFMIRAAGGTKIYSDSELGSGVTIHPGSSAWAVSSDRNLKENFLEVDGSELLSKLAQLRITEWNYKSQDSYVRHIGPVAQDFYALFGFGDDDVTISTIDPAGIALAAIQELHRKNTDLESEVAELKALVKQLLEER